MKTYLQAFFLSLVLVCGECNAQDPDHEGLQNYSVKHYTDENGLPQNSIKSMFMDNEGFIWIATESGLVRFDGQDFFTFTRAHFNMQVSRVQAIVPDRDENSNRFYAVFSNYDRVRIEAGRAVRDTDKYQDKVQGLPLLGAYSNHGAYPALKDGFPDDVNFYISSSENRKQHFFAFEPPRIHFYEEGKKTGSRFYPDAKYIRELFTVKGKLYHLSKGDLLHISPGDVQPVSLEGDILANPAYPSAKARIKLYWNPLSAQAFLLLDRHFYIMEQVSENRFSTRLILQDFNFEFNNIMTVFYEKNAKRLFLGSQSDGLYVLSPKQFKVVRFGKKAQDNVFYGQTVVGKDVITSNGYVVSESGKARASDVIHGFFQAQDPIFNDHQGRTWVCGDGSYLMCYDVKNKKRLGRWRMPDHIKLFYQAEEPDWIWMGMMQKGLWYIDPTDLSGKPKRFSTSDMPIITYILKKDQENLWVGTEKGLYRVHIPSRRSFLIRGTEKLFVRSLYISPSSPADGLFLTTYEDGVFLYSGQKLVQFPIDAKRNIAAAHYIMEDQKGFFWIPTNKGLYQVLKADLLDWAKKRLPQYQPYYKHYTKDQGFLSNEFNGGCQPCAVRLPDGHLSVPSMNGLVRFVPESISADLPDKNIWIDRLEIRERTVLLRGDTVRLIKNPGPFNLRVTTPYFSDADDLNLYYALDDASTLTKKPDWVRLNSQDPVIHFSGLGKGTYQLMVKKINGFGANNTTVKTLILHVPPEWYETIWFRVLCILGLIALLYFYTWLRTRRLKRRNNELETTVRSRTENLEQTLTVLKNSEQELNRQIYIQTRLMASISHDVKTPMKHLISVAGMIDDYIKDGQYNRVSNIGNNIKISADHMLQLLENTIGYIKTQVYHQGTNIGKAFLYQMASEKIELFANAIREQDNRIVNAIPDNLWVETNAQLLGIIIHNLIDNANKYTFGGEIRIYTEHIDQALHLVIADSGRGMPASLAEWLNSPAEVFERSKMMDQEYNGLGLLIVKEITQFIHARLFVQTGNGTRVHIIFPASASFHSKTFADHKEKRVQKNKRIY